MTRSKNGIREFKKHIFVTHYKLTRKKKHKDKIKFYKTETGNDNPVCAQNKKKTRVVRGPSKSKGKNVSKQCDRGLIGASHVRISGQKGIFIVPMCSTHNDSANKDAAPICGDTVRLNAGTIAIRVPDDKGRKRKSNNNKMMQTKKTTVFRRSQNNGDPYWKWNGKRLMVKKYTIDKKSRRVRLKKI